MVLMISSCSSDLTSQIPHGHTIKIDGVKEAQWAGGLNYLVTVSDSWTIKITLMQDEQRLYFLFENLKVSESRELYPEVLIDGANDKSAHWDQNDWWFHTSYSNCEGKRKFNNYSSCKVGPKDGWEGNNFPLEIGQVVEIQIEKELLQVSDGDVIGIAFNVTDTQENWYYFPESAYMESPSSWMTLRL